MRVLTVFPEGWMILALLRDAGEFAVGKDCGASES
jgi:hypothetical protein